MTTIAYKDGKIGYDSRGCRGDVIVNTPFNKRINMDGHTFFFSGSSDQIQYALDGYFHGTPPQKIDGTVAFVVTPDGDVEVMTFDNDGVMRVDDIDPNEHYALGSGAHFAIAAMDLGLSAKEAVKYAATRDIYTGAPFKEYKVR